jgi:hypothetical protein
MDSLVERDGEFGVEIFEGNLDHHKDVTYLFLYDAVSRPSV